MTFRDVKQLPDQIAQHLAEKIIHLELKPGQRILESKLSEELGVSRSPIREALHILNKQFLVDLLPRRGAVVSDFSEDFIGWLYDILGVIYPLLARECVGRFSEEDIAQLKDVMQKMEACAELADHDRYYEYVFEYAAIFIKNARNPIAVQILLNLWPSKRRMEFATLRLRRGSLKDNLKYFRQGTEYFLKGKPDLAEKALQKYIQQEKGCAMALAREFNPNDPKKVSD